MKIEEVKKVFDGRAVGSVNGLYVVFNSDENVSENDIYTLYVEGVKEPYEFSVAQVRTNGKTFEVTAIRQNEGWHETEIDIRSLIGLEINKMTDADEIKQTHQKWRQL